MLLSKIFRSGRVADLPVQDDNVGPGGAQRGKSLAEGGPGRDPVAGLVLRQPELARGEDVRSLAGLGRLHLDSLIAAPTKFPDRLIQVRYWLAVRAFAVLDCRDASAFLCAGNNRRGLPGRGPRRGIGPVDVGYVVAVDLDRIPSEGAHARGVGAGVPAMPGRAALSEPVDIDDR